MYIRFTFLKNNVKLETSQEDFEIRAYITYAQWKDSLLAEKQSIQNGNSTFAGRHPWNSVHVTEKEFNSLNYNWEVVH